MDALKRSLASEKQAAPAARPKAKGKKPKKAAAGQREMLLPISGGGKRAAKETGKEAPKKAGKPARARPAPKRPDDRRARDSTSGARCPGRPVR